MIFVDSMKSSDESQRPNWSEMSCDSRTNTIGDPAGGMTLSFR